MCAAVAMGAMEIEDDSAWAALEQRDRRYDGVFVYAVRTTGVYCRPSCAARRPRRANVAFFATPQLAEEAGFRACRRCRPATAGVAAADEAVARARAYLDANADRTVPLAELARAVGMSSFHLQRKFKERLEVSPKVYADARRIERLKAALRRGDSVSRATYDAGFNSSGPVYARTGSGLGMSPAQYRRGGHGVRISFATAGTSIGRVLVAASDRGVCAVTLGEDDESLERALRDEFHAAELARVDAGHGTLGPWLEAIVRHLDGGEPRLHVPLDVGGTPFQRRVWAALREIPFGETRSYAQVASAIGEPGAARAVARACAANPAAIVIPCHRVVRATGEASGYRWGAERKRRLLAAERAIVARIV
ncbi:MAG TPA: bifunctional DNA-binding transcriptional regulator/O6-methylguanine-DNA methyltransferase Ada [Gemmatimonadaceae bacterium]|nr:bifunctional DNA-binding transcriptional regulator/O6-methylguanine-DNA methyltransferase Ada [Gemmatimonadaceae bacterium]